MFAQVQQPSVQAQFGNLGAPGSKATKQTSKAKTQPGTSSTFTRTPLPLTTASGKVVQFANTGAFPRSSGPAQFAAGARRRGRGFAADTCRPLVVVRGSGSGSTTKHAVLPATSAVLGPSSLRSDRASRNVRCPKCRNNPNHRRAHSGHLCLGCKHDERAQHG